MSEAARLRAQKAFSTDPDYLERMALAEEARDVRVHRTDDRHASSATAQVPWTHGPSPRP